MGRNLAALGIAQDRASVRSAFIRAKKLVKRYTAQLRKIARHVDDIVKGLDPLTAEGQTAIQAALGRYSHAIRPWAEVEAERIVTEVAQADEQSWRRMSAEIGRDLRREIETAPTGTAMRRLMAAQVGLITSLPEEAAQRVHRLATEGLSKGMRAPELAAEILKTGEVTRSRAELIARTEVGRAATTLTQARAEHVGSVGYIWRTAKDGTVRPSHKAMEGRFVEWSNPPTLDGMTGHSGALPNCRCYCEVVLKDD
jgi:SPP1 gp7 family putative phage head morphogenesis protein